MWLIKKIPPSAPPVIRRNVQSLFLYSPALSTLAFSQITQTRGKSLALHVYLFIFFPFLHSLHRVTVSDKHNASV